MLGALPEMYYPSTVLLLFWSSSLSAPLTYFGLSLFPLCTYVYSLFCSSPVALLSSPLSQKSWRPFYRHLKWNTYEAFFTKNMKSIKGEWVRERERKRKKERRLIGVQCVRCPTTQTSSHRDHVIAPTTQCTSERVPIHPNSSITPTPTHAHRLTTQKAH